MTPWLSQDEIDDLCQPLTQAAAQIRYLKRQGLTVRTKPNGAPLVMRQHAEAVLNPVKVQRSPAPRGIDMAGLRAALNRV